MMPDDVNEILRLLIAANELRTTIEKALGRVPLFGQPHFRISSRVKTEARAYDKLSRLRVINPKATPYDIHDLVGFRIVTLFNTSVIDALQVLMDAATHAGHFATNSPFNKKRPILYQYTARPESDPLSFTRELDEWADKQNLNMKHDRTQMLDTLYSSVHFLTSSNLEVEDFHGQKRKVAIPVEVQLRTAMEDVWGQISRVTSYSQPRSNPSIAKHLNALKQMIDGCSLYAEIIRGDSHIVEENRKDSMEAPRARASGIGALAALPKRISSAFDAAVRIRAVAAEAIEPDREMFDDAASKFAKIEQLIVSAKLSKEKQEQALYLARMERAFCLMYSDEPENKDEALALYKALASANGDDALCRFRLGQALKRKDDHEHARDCYLEATNILDENRDLRTKDPISLKSAIQVELAYSYWRIASSAKAVGERRKGMIRAVEVSREAIEMADRTDTPPSEILGAVNNMLYYAWEFQDLFKTSIIERKEMGTFVDRLSPEQITTHFPATKQDAFFDTYLRVIMYLERWDEVRDVAAQTVSLLRKKAQRRSNSSAKPDRTILQKFLTPDELDTYWYASEALSTMIIRLPATKKRAPKAEAQGAKSTSAKRTTDRKWNAREGPKN